MIYFMYFLFILELQVVPDFYTNETDEASLQREGKQRFIQTITI